MILIWFKIYKYKWIRYTNCIAEVSIKESYKCSVNLYDSYCEQIRIFSKNVIVEMFQTNVYYLEAFWQFDSSKFYDWTISIKTNLACHKASLWTSTVKKSELKN